MFTKNNSNSDSKETFISARKKYYCDEDYTLKGDKCYK